MKDILIKSRDEVGGLASICDVLAKANVNLTAIFGRVNDDGSGDVHIAVEDEASATSALGKAGYKIAVSREIIAARLDDSPGALAGFVRKLAEAKVSVDLLYSATGNRVVVAASDLAAVRKIAGQ
jgi:hypothetical protein